ncbi:MAG: tetratricopeptide repeat protein, partial [Planctomycetota bacterium]
ERGESLLERFERVYGAEHRETLGARGNHAVTLFRAERVAESDPLIRDVLEIQKRVLPEDDPDTLWTEMQVAIHDATAGEIDVAVGSLRRIIDVKNEAGMPPVEESVNLGIMLRDLGREDEALQVLGEIRKTAEATIGPDHPTTQMIIDLIDADPR